MIIEITKVSKKEQAQKFVDAINGKTYMEFEVLVAPAYGEFQVNVMTDYTNDREEAQGMLNAIMFNAICN